MSSAGFDNIAPWYRFLSKGVFGSLLLKAQAHFLEQIPAGSRVLITGGGDGKILLVLNTLQPDLRIDYVEISGRMLELARSRQVSIREVKFRNEDIFETALDTYDVIITPFFLDCFTHSELSRLMPRLRAAMAENAIWLFTDFMRTKNAFQQLLTWTMYRFFRASTHITAGQLPDYDKYFSDAGLQMSRNHSWHNGYVVSRIYSVPEAEDKN